MIKMIALRYSLLLSPYLVNSCASDVALSETIIEESIPSLASFAHASTSASTSIHTTTDRWLQELESPRGPGCNFRHTDGTTIEFEEGASMGSFAMVTSCSNDVPEAFPCYCVSDAPGQTVCPYCFYLDNFNQNVCGRADNKIGLLHPNRTFVHCQCDVVVTPTASSYDIDVSSNCELLPPLQPTYAHPDTLNIGTVTGQVIEATAGPGVPDTTTVSPTPLSATEAPVGATTATPVATPIAEEIIETEPPVDTSPPVTSIPVTPGPTEKLTTPPVTNTLTPLPTFAPNTDAPTPVPTNTPVINAPTTTTPITSVPTPLVTVTTAEATVETVAPDPVTYQPGNLTRYQSGMWLSKGLSVKLLAQAGKVVPYHASTPYQSVESDIEFHERPDGAAVFADSRTFNVGGHVYVSNSETQDGSVSAVTFNANGDVIHYHRILTGSMWNCNGGKTPWGTWVTAEEDFDKRKGVAYQVDVFGSRPPEPLTMGIEGGAFEAFAFDIRNLQVPRFFLSEDDDEGALRRWTPTIVNYGMDPWHMLHGEGLTDFLFLEPSDVDAQGGTFRWVTDENEARDNAKSYYKWSEGIEVDPPFLYLVTKQNFRLYKINLDDMTYSYASTKGGLFDGEPDQIKSVLKEDGTTMLYFSEDYGEVSGIHARDESGEFYTILEGPEYSPETAGIAFSPDGKHMYFAFQDDGVLFDVSRDDGHSFHGQTVNLKPRHDENPAKFRKVR